MAMNDASERPEETGTKKGRTLWEILNSQFALWVLGSVVLGFISFVWNWQVASENKTREDSQFVANMLPYLTDNKLEMRVRAAQVIVGRYEKKPIPDETVVIMCNSISGFPEQRSQQTTEIALIYDDVLLDVCHKRPGRTSAPAPVPSASAQATGAPATPTATPSLVVEQAPVPNSRVYIQIYDEGQREEIARVQQALRDDVHKFIAPGIENVASKISGRPVSKTEVRYFNKSDEGTAKYIREFLRKRNYDVDEPKEPKPYPQRANPGTIEIWFAPPKT
jgi:hypothetical protein